jgi:hypothetical protein
MRVYVNGTPVDLLPGMQVRHALLKAGLLKAMEAGRKVYDASGHEMGLEGALSPGLKIYVK